MEGRVNLWVNESLKTVLIFSKCSYVYRLINDFFLLPFTSVKSPYFISLLFSPKGAHTNQVDLELLEVVFRKATGIFEDSIIADLKELQRGEVII